MKRATRNAILDIFYPRDTVCALCGKEAVVWEGVCRACAAELRTVPRLPIVPDLDGFAAGLLLTPAVRKRMHAFKYGRKTWLVDFFAARMSVPPDWTIDAILPVPLHPERLAWRGYNQSELLARALGARYGLPVETALLLRTKETSTQTALTAAQRAQNVRNAFTAANCAGKRLLLVDDVRTTGSTLGACAKALKKAGAPAVYALTAAVAEKEADSI